MAAIVSPFRPPRFLAPSLPFRARAASASTLAVSQSSVSPSRSKKKVLVPVALGTEEMEAVIMVGILRRAGADVTVASVEEGLEIQGSSKTKLLADTLISTCADDHFDLVALPGGMPGSARLRDCKVLQIITTRQAEEKRLYGAISAAPVITLLAWGLLWVKKIACHPSFENDVSGLSWVVPSNVKVSGELITSRGPGTAYEFALSLVEQLFNDKLAGDLKRKLLIETDKACRIEEFNKTEWSFNRVPRVLVPIANGSEEVEVVTIVDVLRRARADVVIGSVENSLNIVACQKMNLIADLLIDAVRERIFDVIILPGGPAGVRQFRKSKVLMKLLKEQKREGRVCGAICSSISILQKEGLLGGGKVTTNDVVVNEPECLQAADGNAVIIDGKVITGGTSSVAIDFSLAIASKLFGPARAACVARGIVVNYPSS